MRRTQYPIVSNMPADYAKFRFDVRVGYAVYVRRDHQAAIAFSGRKGKPDFHRAYQSAEAMRLDVDAYVEEMGRKAKAVAAKLEHATSNQVGDIYQAVWGRSTTDVDYYQVVSISGKSLLWLRPLIKRPGKRGTHPWVPVPGMYTAPPVRRRVSTDGRVKIDDVTIAHKLWPADKPRSSVVPRPVLYRV